MSPRREALVFAATLAVALGGFFAESLLGGRVLSPADVIAATPGFESVHGRDYEPANRLLIDPVLQFQPWLESNRAELRAGRLPLWNPRAGCGAPHLANGQSAQIPLNPEVETPPRVETPKTVHAMEVDFADAVRYWDECAAFLAAEFAGE